MAGQTIQFHVIWHKKNSQFGASPRKRWGIQNCSTQNQVATVEISSHSFVCIFFCRTYNLIDFQVRWLIWFLVQDSFMLCHLPIWHRQLWSTSELDNRQSRQGEIGIFKFRHPRILKFDSPEKRSSRESWTTLGGGWMRWPCKGSKAQRNAESSQ